MVLEILNGIKTPMISRTTKFYRRKAHIELLSYNSIQITNFLYQKKFTIQHNGFSFFDLINIKPLNGQEHMPDIRFWLMIERQDFSIVGTVYVWNEQNRAKEQVGAPICIGDSDSITTGTFEASVIEP